MSGPLAWVTGLGLATPLGVGAEACWRGVLAGERPLVEPPHRRGGIAPRARAAVFPGDFPAEEHTDPRAVRKASEVVRLAAAAAALALRDAGWPVSPAAAEETAVVLGTTFGSSRYYLEFHEGVRRKGVAAANAVLFTESVFNAASGHVSKIHGLRGPSHTLAGGEDVGLSALVTALDPLRLGRLPAALAGGAEQYADFVQASLLAQGLAGEVHGDPLGAAPAPLGEGAALLLLEAPAAAAGRGARCWAQVLGAGRARPGARPGEAGRAAALERAISLACREAGLSPGELDLVVGGAGGGEVAAREREVLSRLLPPASRAAWFAPKAQLGEGFAYTSAAQAALACLCLAAGCVPATPGLSAPPPGTRSPAAPEPAALRTALVLSASGPGAATALVLGAAPPAQRRELAGA